MTQFRSFVFLYFLSSLLFSTFLYPFISLFLFCLYCSYFIIHYQHDYLHFHLKLVQIHCYLYEEKHYWWRYVKETILHISCLKYAPTSTISEKKCFKKCYELILYLLVAKQNNELLIKKIMNLDQLKQHHSSELMLYFQIIMVKFEVRL